MNIYFKSGNMSRLAKKPIALLPGVSITKVDDVLVVKGPKGEKKVPMLSKTNVAIGESDVTITVQDGNVQTRANWGTMAALVRNAMEGVTTGFTKILEIEGVGFKAAMDGSTIVLSLGFVNPVRFTPPERVTISVEKNVVTISGIDKEVVGQVAAQIRANKKPEPYKGKGIRYRGEVIKIKVGKKAAGASA